MTFDVGIIPISLVAILVLYILLGISIQSENVQ
jgi:hypothetical protein